MNEPNTVERVHRSVIERKLLADLESDSDKVAILLTREDLDEVIDACRSYHSLASVNLLDGLEQLRREAFSE